MLRTRVIVGLIGLPLIIAGVLLGGILFNVIVALLLVLGVRELIAFGKVEGYAPSLALAALIVLVIVASVFWPEVLEPGLMIGILLAMAFSLYHFHQGDATPLNSFTITLGVALYVGWMGTHLLMVRAMPAGGWWTMLLLFITFSADSGAYLTGSQFGKHPMAPRVSPKKSWEGYTGGVVFAVVFGGLMGGLWGRSLLPTTVIDGLILGLMIGVIAPLGDLTVSMFKRQAHIKDASNLIPGHGGIMDRLDTLLIAIPLGYYYMVWFVL